MQYPARQFFLVGGAVQREVVNSASNEALNIADDISYWDFNTGQRGGGIERFLQPLDIMDVSTCDKDPERKFGSFGLQHSKEFLVFTAFVDRINDPILWRVDSGLWIDCQ